MRESLARTHHVLGWESRALADVTDLLRRGTSPSYVESSPVRVIGQRCVQWSGFRSEAARPQDPASLSRSLVVQLGDVLLNSTGMGTIGRSCLFDAQGEFVADSHVTVLRVSRRVLDPRWLNLILGSRRGQLHLESHCFSGSTNQVELSRAELARTLIPVPPLSEQRRIVDVIDAVSAQERAIEASMAKLRSVRLGALLGALDSIGREGPPAGWARVPLGDVVPEAEYGISEALGRDSRGLPVLRMNNISHGRPELSDLRYSPVPVAKRLELRHGDVLFNRTNSIDHIGKSGMWREEIPKATFASYLVRINPDATRLIPEYLVEWLMHPLIRQRVRSISTVAVQQVNVNPTRLRELEIDMPIDPVEQRRIVDSLYSCDGQIEGEQAELNKLRTLKQGLVDVLLGGSA